MTAAAERLRRYALPALLALVVVLYLPVLGTGLLADDHYHRFLVERMPADFGKTLNLFGLVRGPEEVEVLRKHGILPWWTSDGLRIDFFRPVPSLGHALDYALFGDHPWVAHLHSLLVYLGLVAAVSALYRRFTSFGVALLATAIFAVDDAHALCVSWIANRADLIGALFLVLGLLRWLEFRARGRARDGALAALLFALAVLSKESSVVFPAVLLLHAVCFRAPRPPRVGIVVAFVAVALYVAWYAHAGHGPRSAYYAGASGLATLAGLATTSILFHAVILATGIPLHALAADPVRQQPLLALALLLVTLLFVVAVVRLVWHEAATRFFAGFTFVTLLLLITGFPDPRLLTLPSIGFSYLAARLVVELLSRVERPMRVAGVVLASAHLVLAPALVQTCTSVLRELSASRNELEDGVSAALDGAGGAETDVLVLNLHHREASAVATLPLVFTQGGVDPTATLHGEAPYLARIDRAFAAQRVHLHVLSFLGDDVRFTLLGPRAFTLEPASGSYLPSLFERLYLTRTRFVVGEVVALPAYRATIEAVDAEGLPTRVRFDLPRPLSQGYRIVRWDGARYAPVDVGAPSLRVARRR